MTHQNKKSEKSCCGLYGKTNRLIQTECCKNWICDDEDKYIAFSYARNSCYRNHSRFTLCGFHTAEGHGGGWKDCSECRNSFKTEMYVWYGTNEYNFEKLENPPAYEPTKCSACGRVIRLGTEGHSTLRGQYWCEVCSKLEEKEVLDDFKKFKKNRHRQ